jgi:hypothetical protein
MTTDERAEFVAQLRTTAGLFGRRLDEAMGQLYAKALDDLPCNRLLVALEALVREADRDARFPMPRELRDRARGIRRRARGLTEAERQRITVAVWTRMAGWEREGHPASAWPAFKRAWHDAVRDAGISGDLGPALQHAWCKWLAEGPPLTSESKRRIVRAVRPRLRPGSPFGAVLTAVAARGEREPGEDDDA